MIDLNALLGNALQQAVDTATAPLVARITELEEAHNILVQRVNALPMAQAAVPAPQVPDLVDFPTGMDYNQKAALVEAFVEKLNNQEWFWGKINDHVIEHVERYHGETPTRDDVKEIAKSTVHELWNDIYETEAQDIAERAIEDHDYSDAVRDAVRELLEGARIELN
jgi:hypothetical protein